MSAARVLARADELATCTSEPGRITRALLTPALADARARVKAWMEEAGLRTREDALGNLAGRRGAPPMADRGARRGRAPRLLIGSHLDTVADAGRYDGVLGILVGIEVAHATDVPLEVVAFADEEGLRFGSIYLGSRAFVGAPLDVALPVELGPPLHDRAITTYLEIHIEQGPVLEAEDAALGVVTAIAGQSRFALTCTGRAAHAGTTPPHLRRDALAAAAELVLAVERIAGDGLVATVGSLRVPHGAANVVPGRVELTLDVRHASDARRLEAIEHLRSTAAEIAARRGVDVTWAPIADQPAAACSPALTDRLGQAVRDVGVTPLRLVSGAGHDAVTMAGVCDVAMLFVRCAGGISHHPDEAVSEADVALAIEAATRFACSI